MDYAKDFGGELFTFLVGANKQKFTVHADAIASISKSLATLIKGQWKESERGYAELIDVEEKVFVNFLEFVYTKRCTATVLEALHQAQANGDFAYNLPTGISDYDLRVLSYNWLGGSNLHCTICGSSIARWLTDTSFNGCSSSCKETAKELSHWGPVKIHCIFCGRKNREGDEHCCDYLKPASDTNMHMMNSVRVDCCNCFNLAINAGDRIDHMTTPAITALNMNVLLEQILHHCKVYIFADLYSIKPLKFWAFSLTWMHLSMLRHQILCNDDTTHPPNFADVLQYVTSNTKNSSGIDPAKAETERLCKLVTDFAVDQMPSLVRHPAFKELIETNLEVMRETFLAALRGCAGRWHSTRPNIQGS